MKQCIVCGESYTNPGRRCNSCRNKAWKLVNRERDLEQRRAYNHRRWEKVKPIVTEKHCEYCGKVFLPNRRTPNQPYCSAKCRLTVYRKTHKEDLNRWRRESYRRHTETKRKTDATYKDKIRFSGNREPAIERDNNTCQNCGKQEPRLNVHHIDLSGQSDNPNNDLGNLITLCAACHIRIHKH